MKIVSLKVDIEVPDDLVIDDIDWLLQDAIGGFYDYSIRK